MEMTMRFVLTIVVLVLLQWVEPAAAQTPRPPHQLNVRVHPSIHISESAVREILRNASHLLQEEGDVHCDVSFELASLDHFQSNAPKDITNATELEAVHREPGEVKIVD